MPDLIELSRRLHEENLFVQSEQVSLVALFESVFQSSVQWSVNWNVLSFVDVTPKNLKLLRKLLT